MSRLSQEFLDGIIERRRIYPEEAYLAETVLRGANLLFADLRDADLREADLREADLREADLREANLLFADLRDADLRDADLRHTDLRYADLRDADLRGADLYGARIRGAVLDRDTLTGDQLDDTIYGPPLEEDDPGRDRWFDPDYDRTYGNAIPPFSDFDQDSFDDPDPLGQLRTGTVDPRSMLTHEEQSEIRRQFIERQEELQRGQLERSRREAERSREEVNPCTRHGSYKCYKCNGKEDPITYNEIKKGICADKQCYEFDDLLRSLESNGEIPLSKNPMTSQRLREIQKGDDECGESWELS